MKKLLLVALISLFLIPLQAQEDKPAQRLVVHQRTGEKVFFDLEEEPVTTFDKGNLVIKTSKTTVIYLLENVQKYTYEGVSTGIEQPAVAPGNLLVRQNNEMMTIDGLKNDALVEIYSADGKLLQSTHAKQKQTTVLSLQNYSPGTYIINAGGASFKFVKQ